MTDETSQTEARMVFAHKKEYITVQRAVVEENIQFVEEKCEALQKYMFRFVAVPLICLDSGLGGLSRYGMRSDNVATHYVFVTSPDETQSTLLPEINGSVDIYLNSQEILHPLPRTALSPLMLIRVAIAIQYSLVSAKHNALEALDKARHTDGSSSVSDQDCVRVYDNALKENALDIFWNFVPSGVHEHEEAANLVRRLVRSEGEPQDNWLARLVEFVRTTHFIPKPARNEYGLPFKGHRIAPPPGVSTNAALFLVKVPVQNLWDRSSYRPPLRYKFEHDADAMNGTTREWWGLLESLNHSVTGIISVNPPLPSLRREIRGLCDAYGRTDTDEYISYITSFEPWAPELNFNYFESFPGMQLVQDELCPDEANILDGLRRTIGGKVHIAGPTKRKTRLSANISKAVLEHGVHHKHGTTGESFWNKGLVVWMDTDDDQARLTALRFSKMEFEKKDSLRIIHLYDFDSEMANFGNKMAPRFMCTSPGSTAAKAELIDHIENTARQRPAVWLASSDRYSVSETAKQIIRNEPERSWTTPHSPETQYSQIDADNEGKVHDMFMEILYGADIIIGTVAAFGSYQDFFGLCPTLLVVDNAHQYTESKMLTALGMFPGAPTIMAGSLDEPGPVSEMNS